MKSRRYTKVLLVLILTLTLFVSSAGSDVSALGPGSISGTVHEVDGVTPIEGIYVSASADGHFASDCTDASGSFTLTDLPLDVELQVHAAPTWDNCGEWTNYLEEFWQEADHQNNATPVVLSAGNPDQTDIDFTLEAGGSISGTVYAADNVTTLASTLIVIESQDNLYSQATCADENGDYIFHSVPLNIPVRAKARSNLDIGCNTGEDYLMEYWPETPNVEDADFITLTALSDIQTGIDFTLEEGGSITGTVYEADGVTPISNIWVVATGSPDLYSGDCTDASGNFIISALPLDTPLQAQASTFGVNCGEWKDFTPEYWFEKATQAAGDAIVLTAGNPDRTGVNFTLDPGGEISGVVYEADGVTPIAGIFVAASGNSGFGTNGCTDENGRYRFVGLPFDEQFRVQASPWWANCGSWKDYVEEYWPETRDHDSASFVVVTAEVPQQTEIDFTLDQGGVISGTTYAADGITILPHISISFDDDNNTYHQAVCSDENGNYEFHGAPLNMPLQVRADSYRDSWCDSGGDYIPEYWQEASDSASAAPITLTELSSTQSGIDFTLDPAGSISGTVYDGVTPVANMLVSLVGNDYFQVSECTDSSGHYTIHNVPFDLAVYAYTAAGNTWCGDVGNYAVEFWPGVPNLDGATLLTVDEQEPELNINFTLDAAPASDAHMDTFYQEDIIRAYDWTLNAHLTLNIDDPTTPLAPDYAAETDVLEYAPWGPTVGVFDLNGQFDIQPGMLIGISGSSESAFMLVDPLTITEIDPVTDTITGTTRPNNWLWMYFEPSCCRSINANGSGVWTVNYSVPGPNAEPIADVGPGSYGTINVPGNGGNTSVNWGLPAKTLHVVPKYPEVHGHDWPAGSTVTLTIDNDNNPANGTLYSETKNADDEPIWCGYPCFDLSGILDLDKDLYVTLSDGIDTKTVQISRLEITSINLATNTISGRADPGSRVAVNIWSQNGIARYVKTNSSGIWVANFSTVGDEDFEQELADIVANDSGRAIQLNPDGSDDGTLEYWTAEIPTVDSSVRASANPTNAATVNFTVTFSDTVSGVDLSDFTITKTGLTETAVTKVIGSGDTYTVTVKTGSGNGTLRLNVVDNDSIRSELNIPLGGPGAGNGIFNTGEEYTVARSAPGIPVLLSPAAEALLNTLQPVLDWKDSAPVADHYQVQVAMNSNFSSLVWDETDLVASTFPITADLLPGKLYYWRVRAFNLFDVASGWSIVRAFKTPLAQPVLVAPTEGASLLTDRPLLDWDAVDGATSYILHVSAQSTFSTLLVNVTGSASEYAVPKDLPQNKLLHWRVRARTSSVTGPWSATGTFTTGNPPSVPVLVAPKNNSLTKNYTPTFNWNNSKVATGTTFKHYEIQWDDDPQFASPETATTAPDEITDSDFTPSLPLAANTKYYWRVRAVNLFNGENHTSGWSAVWTVRAAILPPSGLSVTPNPLLPRRPTFEWDDATGPGEIRSYTIQVSTGSSFSILLVNSTTPDSFYEMTKNLPTGKTLHWRVRVNGPNGPSAWTTVQYIVP